MARILFYGEMWLGSSARACSAALRRLGHEVSDVDPQTVFPQWRGTLLRIARRALRSAIVHEVNAVLRSTLEDMRPDYLVVFKGTFLHEGTLQHAKRLGAVCINYYPDNSIFAHGPEVLSSLSEYDLVCPAHRHTVLQFEKLTRKPVIAHVAHGYDQDLHRASEKEGPYAADVAFIGTYSPQKEEVLASLLEAMPNIALEVRGDQWLDRCRSRSVRDRLSGRSVAGQRYVQAITGSRIVLGLTSEAARGASEADAVTTRSLEIPACGGFMLHSRNDEIRELFEEGEEMECFSTVDELCSKIAYFLAHDEERKRISKKGHARCVPAYSYDARMAELMKHGSEVRCR